MPNYTCTVTIGTHSEVCVDFNYEPSDPECGLGAEIEINTIGFMNLNSIDCIMRDLSFDCVERIRVECFKYVEVQRGNRL